MNEHFELLHERLKLTPNQRSDVKRKYDGVSKSLYKEFYEGDYDSRTRLIIGSHGKNTEGRYPIRDIDLIFKISKEDIDRYQSYGQDSNGPSALLQRARKQLQTTYPNTSEIKSWGKVVLVAFGDGQHDVEVMPCFEEEDGKFTIPNTEGNGTWDTFDPREEIRAVASSQQETGITRQMIRIAKRWRSKNNVRIKSYQIEFFCISFLSLNYMNSKSWSQLFEEFFVWLELQSDDYEKDALSKVQSAMNRSKKARDFELKENFSESCKEWRKVFGRQFPLYDKNLATVKSLEKSYPIESEEFIHDRFPVKIDRGVQIKINSRLKRNGFRDYQGFSGFFGDGHCVIPFEASLEFKVKCSLGRKANYYWKIRNFNDEARDANDLRGEIVKDKDLHKKYETSRYAGTHYVDCYAVRAGVVVAVARRFVPIGDDK